MGWIKRRTAAPEPAPVVTYEESPERHVLGLLAESLNARGGGWEITEATKGPLLMGPRDDLAVIFDPGACGDDDPSPEHLSLLVLYGLGRPGGATRLIDCVSVPGPDLETSLQRAAETWADTTGAALLAALGLPSPVAGHFGGDDPNGVPGWHIVAGGVGGYGAGPEHSAVKDWLFDNPPWRLLVPALGEELDRSRPHAVKVFLAVGKGTVTSEVRLDGEVHEEASLALMGADWPRVRDVASVGRLFAMLAPMDDEDCYHPGLRLVN
ncbi:DUF6348 family protein [Catenulispora yoronensis]